MKSAALTDIGRKRAMNQDYIYRSDGGLGNLPNLYIVADGMGGHKAGDFASRFTVTEMIRAVKEAPEKNGRDIIDLSLHHVNAALHHISETQTEMEGCGTTFVASYIQNDILHVANVGDSRLYIAGPTLRQVTVDHSLVQEMIDAGSLTRQGAKHHPEKNVITRAVGAEDYIDIDFFTSDLHRGDIVLMCSDGLTNMVEEGDILSIIKGPGTLQERASRLVQKANENGGLDNISVILVDPFENNTSAVSNKT
ncbi:MAG: Stp1/IreP family PP2C-type Ser/Thr phosphatase [Lachnospiraceae bacterium]|jgi:serine/threonine protein phosphatase PrpC|nr:Stp1/IreP family PP2C-type Ser/Thr phosphatase [Lachnospiraceae bacterium]